MLSDIEIAQGCKMRSIIDVAADAGKLCRTLL